MFTHISFLFYHFEEIYNTLKLREMADWRCKSKYEEKFANPMKQVLPEFLFDDKNISLKFDVP